MDPQAEYTKWLAYVTDVPDPRKAQGKRYALGYVLVLLCAGLAAGQKSVDAIAQWAREHVPELLAVLAPRNWPRSGASTGTSRTACIMCAMRRWAKIAAAAENRIGAIRVHGPYCRSVCVRRPDYGVTSKPS